MANLTGFDATTVKPAEDFGVIPPGEYQALIVDSAMKPTKDGKGSYLELTYQVVGGEHANRKVWSRHNLDNKSEVARGIAERELSAVCHAVGVLKPTDSVQLHNKVLLIRVEIEAADGQARKKDQNVVKAWKALDGTSAPVAAPAPASAGKSPWGGARAA